MDVRRNSFRCLIIKPEALGGARGGAVSTCEKEPGVSRADFINYPGGHGDVAWRKKLNLLNSSRCGKRYCY